jgi:hypothetical protein
MHYRSDPFPPGFSLVHSTIVLKHGLRAPLDKIPGTDVVWNCSGPNWLYPGGDPLNDELEFANQFEIRPLPNQTFLKGNCRAGELLPEGIRQMRQLSDYIATVYPSILPRRHAKRSISFRSTYTNRCLASLQVLSDSLLSGSDPVDVFVANEELESLIPNSFLCPSLESQISAILDENSSFGQQLSLFTEKVNLIKIAFNLSAIPHWMRMGEFLVTLQCANVTFPPGFDEDLMIESTDLLVNYSRHLLSTNENRKFGAGILLSEIYVGMRDYLSGASDARIALICGHTMSILSLMAGLNLTMGWPEFGSIVAFEVLKKEEELMVRVALNGKAIAVYGMAEFRELAMGGRPTEEECRVRYPFPERDKKAAGTKITQLSFS